MILYIEGCESQFFRFNRSMTFRYIMLSPGGAIIANKYLRLKGVWKKFGIWGPIRVRSRSDPGPIRKFFGEEICGSDPDRTWIGPGSDLKFSKKSIASVCKDEVV